MRTKLKGLLTLVMALMLQAFFAQQHKVTGTVTDASTGEPLPGVNVVIEGTTKGTVTDFDGKYVIEASPEDVLVFSYVGYQEAREKVGDRSQINVALKPGETLETVVINAMGVAVKKRTEKALSVTKVKADKILKSGADDPVGALSGKVAGVFLYKVSGDPGAATNINIRGPKSILGSMNPLIVVDGVPMNAGMSSSSVDGVERPSKVMDIDPNDIESIKVIKGGAAAAIWGSEGANGVILIVTKSGSKSNKGQIRVTLNSGIAFETPLTRYPLQDKFGKGLNGEWDPSSSFRSAGSWGDKIADRPGGDDVVDTQSGLYFEDQDGRKWYPIIEKRSKEIFNDKNYNAVINTGMRLKNGIQVFGGSPNVKSYLSINDLRHNGIFENSKYNKTDVLFKNTVNIGDKVTVGTTVFYAHVFQNAIQKGSNLSGLLLGLYRTPPDFDNSGYIGDRHVPGRLVVKKSHRSYRRYLGTNYKQGPGYNNPLFTVYEQYNPFNADHVLGGVNLTYNLMDNFSIMFNNGLDFFARTSTNYFPINSGEDPQGRYSSSTNRDISLDTKLMAQYTPTIGDDMTLDILGGYQFQLRNYRSHGVYYRDFLLNLDNPNTDNAKDENKSPGLFILQKRKISGFFSGTFSYKKLLFATLTGRVEQSSYYGPEAKAPFFPGFSLAFDVAQLESMSKYDWLNSLVLRGSYSIVGLEPPYAYLGYTYYVGASDSDGWGSSWSASAYDGSIWRDIIAGNPQIGPEKTRELEFGFDLKMLDNRLNTTFSYYNDKSYDLILYVPKPASSGYQYRWENIASMVNKGIELEMSYDVISKKDMRWTIGGTYTTNNNVVTSLPGAEYVGLNGFTSTSSGVAEGQPYGVLRSGDFKRNADGSLVLDPNGFPVRGDVIFAGDPYEDFKGSLYSDVHYKGFNFHILFDGAFGGQAWDGTTGALTYFGRTLETANEVTVDSKTAHEVVNYAGIAIADLPYAKANSDGTYTVRGNITDFGGGDVLLDQYWYRSLGGGFGPVGTQFFRDATWMKLRELAVDYTFNIKDSFVKSVKVGVTGRNLYLWTKDKNWHIDPETNLTGPSKGRGLQYFNHPTAKSILFNTVIKF